MRADPNYRVKREEAEYSPQTGAGKLREMERLIRLGWACQTSQE